MTDLIAPAAPVFFATEDDLAQFFARAEDGTVWLTQDELGELFQTTPQKILQLVSAIYNDHELCQASTCKHDWHVHFEGLNQLRRTIKRYNLEMILAIGYRVKSPRGVRFRQWATARLKAYWVKGLALDHKRLKDPESADHFEELLQRVRDMRSSEVRFHQEVRDLFARSVDYTGDIEAADAFFAEVQDKMFFAVTSHTATELVVQRADSMQPHMALTAWASDRVCKADVSLAKNYLNAEELNHFNRIVSMFLDSAELRAESKKVIRMADWRAFVDRFLELTERAILQRAARADHHTMISIAHERYEQFDAARRKSGVLAADQADRQDLEQLRGPCSSMKREEKRMEEANKLPIADVEKEMGHE